MTTKVKLSLNNSINTNLLKIHYVILQINNVRVRILTLFIELLHSYIKNVRMQLEIICNKKKKRKKEFKQHGWIYL